MSTSIEVVERNDHGPQTGSTVAITVNNVEHQIHRGRQSVAVIKRLAGIPLADDLDQLIDCRLVHLPDDGSVTIKGGEVFVSHVKDGGAS